MVVRSALPRPAAVLAAVALAAGGAAGCGGGSDDGSSGGDGGAAGGSYAATWNAVCTSLTTAQTTLQSDGVAAQKAAKGKDAAAQAKAFGVPVSRFADAMAGALERVKDLDAPEGLTDFQAKVAKSAPGTISLLRRVEAPLKAGDVQAAQGVLGQIDQDAFVPPIPAALKKQATACNVF